MFGTGPGRQPIVLEQPSPPSALSRNRVAAIPFGLTLPTGTMAKDLRQTHQKLLEWSTTPVSMLGQSPNPVPTAGLRQRIHSRRQGDTHRSDKRSNQKVTASSFTVRHHATLPMIIPAGDIAATFAPANCSAVSAAYTSTPNVTVTAVRTQCFGF